MINSKTLFIEKCNSTQLVARQMISDGKPVEKMVIVADEQSAGKGQGKNTWISEPEKNLLCSVIYPYKQKAEKQSYISRAISLALCDLVSLYSSDFLIKWPNDILMDQKKVAGILIEHNISGAHIQYSIIGIGLNVNQEVFPAGLDAISLIHSTGTNFRIKEILGTLMSCIDGRLFLYENHKWDILNDSYHSLLYGYNQECRFRLNDGKEFTAINKGVDEFGRIILEHEGKTEHFDLNEVHIMI